MSIIPLSPLVNFQWPFTVDVLLTRFQKVDKQNQSVSRSVRRSVRRLVGQSVRPSVRPSVSQSVSQSITHFKNY